jgi:hypothetical protein
MRGPAEYAADVERDVSLPTASGNGSPATASCGSDLGAIGPPPERAQLRGFAIPQRGVFVVGRGFFEPGFTASRRPTRGQG